MTPAVKVDWSVVGFATASMAASRIVLINLVSGLVPKVYLTIMPLKQSMIGGTTISKNSWWGNPTAGE
jgi:hypothetical protein